MILCINPDCAQPSNSDNVLFCQSCGSDLLLEGHYRAIHVLGGGGFGKTYEVSDHNSIKVLKVLINNSTKAVELFQREAQVLSQTNHPGIPKVEQGGYFIFYPKNSQQPLYCLVMEKIEGLNLRDYIEKKGQPINNDLAVRWLRVLVGILEKLHSQGIIHRDIKPQNIILLPDGNLSLIDFGAVTEGNKTEEGTKTSTRTAGGTSISSTGYTPTEQINGQAVLQSDFYALGRTFIYLMTAKEPTDMYDSFNDEIDWRRYATGVLPDLADFIDWMCKRTVKERPNDAQAILQVLQGLTSKQTYTTQQSPIEKKALISEPKKTNPQVMAESQKQYSPKDKSRNLIPLSLLISGLSAVFYFMTHFNQSSVQQSPIMRMTEEMQLQQQLKHPTNSYH